MRRAAGTILLFAATMAVAGAASSSAPADETFGAFKYTAISTRTKIDALARSYHERWSDDASIVHDAGMVESSYRAWAQRYPKDPWLAPTAYHLAQLYAVVQTPDARAHALALFNYVAQTFPNTKEGHLARLRLRQGLPPVHAEQAVRRTPNPYASTAPSTMPSASAIPAPSPSGSAVPVPSPSR